MTSPAFKGSSPASAPSKSNRALHVGLFFGFGGGAGVFFGLGGATGLWLGMTLLPGRLLPGGGAGGLDDDCCGAAPTGWYLAITPGFGLALETRRVGTGAMPAAAPSWTLAPEQRFWATRILRLVPGGEVMTWR